MSRSLYLGLGQVAQCMADATLQQLDLDQDHLVIQLLELLEQSCNQSQRVAVHLVVEVQGDQSRLQRLFQKDAFLLNGPLDCLLANVDLQRESVGDLRKVVDQGADYFVPKATADILVSIRSSGQASGICPLFSEEHVLILAVLALGIDVIRVRESWIRAASSLGRLWIVEEQCERS